MPHYMLQAAYTPDAVATFTRNPRDRTVTVLALAQRFNCRVESIYFCFGDYDVVIIYEAPDNITAASVSLAATSAGHLKSVKTTKLLTPDEFVEAQRKAGSITENSSNTG